MMPKDNERQINRDIKLLHYHLRGAGRKTGDLKGGVALSGIVLYVTCDRQTNWRARRGSEERLLLLPNEHSFIKKKRSQSWPSINKLVAWSQKPALYCVPAYARGGALARQQMGVPAGRKELPQRKLTRRPNVQQNKKRSERYDGTLKKKPGCLYDGRSGRRLPCHLELGKRKTITRSESELGVESQS